MPRRKRARKPEDLCLPIALACGVVAFLWLAYYLFLAPPPDQAGVFVPVTAICLNPLTLVFTYTDSLFLFSMLVLVSDLLVYGALGVLVSNLLRKRLAAKKQALPQT